MESVGRGWRTLLRFASARPAVSGQPGAVRLSHARRVRLAGGAALSARRRGTGVAAPALGPRRDRRGDGRVRLHARRVLRFAREFRQQPADRGLAAVDLPGLGSRPRDRANPGPASVPRAVRHRIPRRRAPDAGPRPAARVRARPGRGRAPGPRPREADGRLRDRGFSGARPRVGAAPPVRRVHEPLRSPAAHRPGIRVGAIARAGRSPAPAVAAGASHRSTRVLHPVHGQFAGAVDFERLHGWDHPGPGADRNPQVERRALDRLLGGGHDRVRSPGPRKPQPGVSSPVRVGPAVPTVPLSREVPPHRGPGGFRLRGPGSRSLVGRRSVDGRSEEGR